MKTYKLNINTKSKKYKVVIGSNLLKNVSKILSEENIYFDKCLILVDKNIPNKFKSLLKNNLKIKKK